jgi:hypothetical protein
MLNFIDYNSEFRSRNFLQCCCSTDVPSITSRAVKSNFAGVGMVGLSLSSSQNWIMDEIGKFQANLLFEGFSGGDFFDFGPRVFPFRMQKSGQGFLPFWPTGVAYEGFFEAAERRRQRQSCSTGTARKDTIQCERITDTYTTRRILPVTTILNRYAWLSLSPSSLVRSITICGLELRWELELASGNVSRER